MGERDGDRLGEDELLDEDMSALPLEKRLGRARTFLTQLAEDDWTQCGFVIDAARAVAGPAASPAMVRETAMSLYASFVDDERVRVLDRELARHYVDAAQLRADIAVAWPDAEVEPPLEDMPWLVWRADDETPPGPAGR